MPRYFRMNLLEHDRFQVTGEEAHHLSRVMRKGPGDTILLNDGAGRFYQGVIDEASLESVTGRLLEMIPADVEPKTRIILCQAMPKGDKMEEIIRKGTEIGVTEFLPFISKRCVSRPEAGKAADRRLERWRRIAEEAAKQAGRAVVPTVHPIGEWSDVHRLCHQSTVIVAWEGERKRGVKEALSTLPEDHKSVAFVIGSEGGFDAAEIQQAEAAGASTVSLGPRIMRTETAGPVLAAVALFAWDEMEPEGGGDESC